MARLLDPHADPSPRSSSAAWRQRRLRHRAPAEHAGHLRHAPGRLEALHAHAGAARGDPLLDSVLHVRQTGNLRQVGDAEDLAPRRDRPQPLADGAGRAAADADVDLVEDQRRHAVGLRERRLEREHHPRELAARGHPRQRARLDAGVGREQELRPLDAALVGPPAPAVDDQGPRRVLLALQPHLEAAPPHRERAPAPRGCASRAAARAASRPRESSPASAAAAAAAAAISRSSGASRADPCSQRGDLGPRRPRPRRGSPPRSGRTSS